MDNQNKYKTVKKDNGLKFQSIMAIVTTSIGLLSLLFLLCPGITYSKVGYYSASFNLGNMIFGTDWAGVNPGLLAALIVMVVSVIASGISIVKPTIGIISIIGFASSAILWCCTIPMYGNYYAGLGSGAICLITFNFLCSLLSFISVSYR